MVTWHFIDAALVGVRCICIAMILVSFINGLIDKLSPIFWIYIYGKGIFLHWSQVLSSSSAQIEDDVEHKNLLQFLWIWWTAEDCSKVLGQLVDVDGFNGWLAHYVSKTLLLVQLLNTFKKFIWTNEMLTADNVDAASFFEVASSGTSDHFEGCVFVASFIIIFIFRRLGS